MPHRAPNDLRFFWARPIFRWAGSKRKLLPALVAKVPANYGRYVEPFAGSACLFFALRPSRAVLGDYNGELIDAYRTIRSHPRRVSRKARTWKISDRTYLHLRALDPFKLDPVLRAARFLYLNRTCFNGVFRTNRSGQFNVPRGRNTGRFPSEQEIYRCSVALRVAHVCHADFSRVVHSVRSGDFVYLDPPYPSKPRPRYGEYGYGCFGPADVPRLMKLLHRIDNSGARFLLSYASVSELAKSPSHWKYEELSVRRHVGGFASSRQQVTEVLVSNY